MPKETMFTRRSRTHKVSKAPPVQSSEIYRGFVETVKTEDFFSRALMAYLAHLGDVTKASEYLGCTRDKLQEQVNAGRWDQKLQELLEVREKKGAAEYAKQINRLMNLTQAVRIRALVDNVLKTVTTDQESMRHFLSVPTKNGRAFSAKGLTELAKAAQIAQQATYAALADQTTERIFDKKQEPGQEGESPQLSVFKALAQLAHGPTTEETIPTTAAGNQPGPDRPAGDQPGQVTPTPEG